MTAGAWIVHDKLIERMGKGDLDFDTDAFKCALFLSTSNAATPSVADYASLTNEHANGDGYVTGGDDITLTWSESSGVVTFDTTDPTWNASGGDIVARFAVIYDNTDGDKTIVAHCLLDDTPADVTAVDGNPLTIQQHANGVFHVP